MMEPVLPPGQQAPLGALLVQTAQSILDAQRVLDTDAAGRVALYAMTPQGEITLPPIWYRMQDVTVALELAATLTRQSAGTPGRLDARLLNPAAISLFGYRAASGLRVQFTLQPRDGTPLPQDH